MIASFTPRLLLRWLAAAATFPLGGLLGGTIAGPANAALPALGSGLLAGATIGFGQGVALKLRSSLRLGWAIATAVGLAIGLAAGTVLFGATSWSGEVLLVGGISGLAAGGGQALLLHRNGVPAAWAWPLTVAVSWILGWLTMIAGWLVYASIEAGLAPGWPIFGITGALVAQLLSGLVLERLLSRPGWRQERTS